MFCGNCGRQFKEGESFCTYCGKEKVIPTVKIDVNLLKKQTNNNVPKKVEEVKTVVSSDIVDDSTEPKTTGGKIITSIGGLFLLSFTILMWSLSVMAEEETDSKIDMHQIESYVNVEDVSVPTVYKLVDSYVLCNIDESSNEVNSIYYCDNKFTVNVMDEYLDILIDKYGYKELNDSNDIRSVMFVDERHPEYTVVVEVDYSKEVINYYKFDNVVDNEETEDKNDNNETSENDETTENDETSENIKDNVTDENIDNNVIDESVENDKDDINVLQ